MRLIGQVDLVKLHIKKMQILKVGSRCLVVPAYIALYELWQNFEMKILIFKIKKGWEKSE